MSSRMMSKNGRKLATQQSVNSAIKSICDIPPRRDGGQFFTPREVIRAMVKVIDPKIGETLYAPGCGTGGFLAQSFSSSTSSTA